MFVRSTVSEKRRAGLLVWLGGATLLASAMLLAGCTQVIGYNSPYYKNGPAQREGPQGTIPAGTPVWVLGKEGSYTHVFAANGVNGYVWDSSIVTSDEWSRRQAIEKQNEEALRRARAKGDGPLGPPELAPSAPAPRAANTNRPQPAPNSPTPPRSSTGAWPGK
jgi:hypothetical protein